MDQGCRRKRDRSNAENELKYKQNKRILNEGLQSLNLNHYTTITDTIDDDIDQPICTNDENVNHDTDVCKSDYETDDEHHLLPPEEEQLISVLKGGQIKYLRKVDFLVDELIRKTHRTEMSKQFCPQDFDSKIPDYVGPSPTADHALSMPLWPVKIFDSTHFLEGANVDVHPHRLATRSRNGSNAVYVDDQDGGMDNTYHYDQMPNTPISSGYLADDDPVGYNIREHHHIPHNQLAGDTTHSDWGIEEVRRRTSAATAPRSPSHLSTAAVAEHNNGHNNSGSSSGNQFTQYRRNSSDSNQHQQSSRQLGGVDSDEEEDDVMVSVWNNGDSDNNSVDGSVDSTHSNMSTLSAESAPRVPYYIDADDNVYYMLDPETPSTNGGAATGGAGRGRPNSALTNDTKTNSAASERSSSRRNYLSATPSTSPRAYHLVDEEEAAARYLGIRPIASRPIPSQQQQTGGIYTTTGLSNRIEECEMESSETCSSLNGHQGDSCCEVMRGMDTDNTTPTVDMMT